MVDHIGTTTERQDVLDFILFFLFLFNYTLLFLMTDIQLKFNESNWWYWAELFSVFKCGCLQHLFRGEPSVTTMCYGAQSGRLPCDGQNRELPKTIRRRTNDP